MRSKPQERKAFIRTLPNDILGALVIVLSDLPVNSANPSFDHQRTVKHPLNAEEPEVGIAESTNKHFRKSAVDVVSSAPHDVFEIKQTAKKPVRKSESSRRINRRVSTSALAATESDPAFTPEKEMEYCRDLIKRMNSGPGYWTRYVSNFKKPVDPVFDDAPNYFAVVKKPMCLNSMKAKMDNGEYANGAEFEADIQLIFQNCYEYWTPADQIWKECALFEEFFNTQWAQRNKYATGKRFASSVKSEAIS